MAQQVAHSPGIRPTSSTVTNTSGENILLDLDSGPLRLDVGRTLRLTRSALEAAATDLAGQDQGKVKVQPFKLEEA